MKQPSILGTGSIHHYFSGLQSKDDFSYSYNTKSCFGIIFGKETVKPAGIYFDRYGDCHITLSSHIIDSAEIKILVTYLAIPALAAKTCDYNDL
jgi:hypothetical protein